MDKKKQEELLSKIFSEYNTSIDEIIILAYEDQGPSGACGQVMSVTAPWHQLLIFFDFEEAKEFQENIYKHNPHRINPRIVDSYYGRDIKVMKKPGGGG